MTLAREPLRMSDPDASAVRSILAVVPALRSLARAGEALGLGSHELLHAGPPISDGADACAPIAHSAITAILFERWADTVESAGALLRTGAIRLRPAQDNHCVVPLADVLSPSMWVQEVGDLRSPASVAWSPLNGGIEHVLRVGILGKDVLTHLRWINGPFADALALALNEPIPLLGLADEGIAGGDDCHGRTGVATAALASRLEHRWTGTEAVACREFLSRAPSFFLNVWMAASKCMLDAARGVAASSAVVAAGGNGEEFGIQLASQPGTWFTTRAEPPAVQPGLIVTDAVPLGAIGDSAVVDLLGLGAMTTPAVDGDERLQFADILPDAVAAPRSLLMAAHPGFPRVQPRMVITARRVLESAQAPVVSLGVLDKTGKRGRLAGGFYRPPLDLFERAVRGAAI